MAHPSTSLMEQIAEAFFYAGFIEGWGSGTLRMVDELHIAGLSPPQFESEAGRFRLRFYKQTVAKKHFD